VDGSEHFAEGDFPWMFGEAVASLLSANASDQLARFQIDHDLDEVVSRDPVLRAYLLDLERPGVAESTRKTQHSAGCIIALHGKFHPAPITRLEL